MAEYIERETALKNIKETIIGASEFANDIRIAAINAVNSAPTADVQDVRHGKWIPYEIDFPMFSDIKIVNYTCSECGRKLIGYSNPKDAPYCHCGAKMDEE